MIVVPVSASCGLSSWESPATDYTDLKLSLDEVLIERPSSTFLARAQGDSMEGVGIFDKDLLVIDRHPIPEHMDTVIVIYNGTMMCKMINLTERLLLSSKAGIEPIYVSPDDAFWIEGVVIRSIRLHKPASVLF